MSNRLRTDCSLLAAHVSIPLAWMLTERLMDVLDVILIDRWCLPVEFFRRIPASAQKSFSGCLCRGHPIFMLNATVYNQFTELLYFVSVFFPLLHINASDVARGGFTETAEL